MSKFAPRLHRWRFKFSERLRRVRMGGQVFRKFTECLHGGFEECKVDTMNIGGGIDGIMPLNQLRNSEQLDTHWGHEDRTDQIVVDKLLEKGIPKSDMVIGFHAPIMRGDTEFAVA